MIVSDVRQSVTNARRELSATVTFEKTGARQRYFIRVPDLGAAIPNAADSFLVGLILPSMALGERLLIEAPVSSDIAANVMDKTVPLMQKWFPRLHAPRAELDLVSPARESTDSKTGSLFSGGVDSWHTFLRRENHIDQLVHIHGFEILIDNTLIWGAAHKWVQEIAAAFGKTVVPVVTNFREASLPHVGENPDLNWRQFGSEVGMGHQLCAIALALRPGIGQLFIPSSYSAGTERVASHSDIEPALSVPSMRFILEGFELNRMQKLDAAKEFYPEFVQRLRVCVNYEYTPSDGTINCGNCIKCTRTALELRVRKIAVPDNLFKEQVELKAFHYKKMGGNRELWKLLADEAEKRDDLDVHAAVMCILEPNKPARRLRRFFHRIGRRIRSSGAAS